MFYNINYRKNSVKYYLLKNILKIYGYQMINLLNSFPIPHKNICLVVVKINQEINPLGFLPISDCVK